MKNGKTKLANLLIQRRNINSSWKHVFKYGLKMSFVWLIMIALVMTAFVYRYGIDDPIVHLMLGFYAGMLSVYLGNIIKDRRFWWFTEKVIDWQKVEELTGTNADTK